jgi:hypothetical protein
MTWPPSARKCPLGSYCSSLRQCHCRCLLGTESTALDQSNSRSIPQHILCRRQSPSRSRNGQVRMANNCPACSMRWGHSPPKGMAHRTEPWVQGTSRQGRSEHSRSPTQAKSRRGFDYLWPNPALACRSALRHDLYTSSNPPPAKGCGPLCNRRVPGHATPR